MAFRIVLRERGVEQEVMKWAGGINLALVIKERFKGGRKSSSAYLTFNKPS